MPKSKGRASINLKYVLPAALAIGIGVLFVSGTAQDVYQLASPTATPVTYQSGLEVKVKEISLEMAKRNEHLRQAYLNQLFTNRNNYGIEGWDYFDAFIYDPDLKIKADLERAGKKQQVIEGYEASPFQDTAMLTLRKGLHEHTPVYVARLAFDSAYVDDDFRSMLDNEAFNAVQEWNGYLDVSKFGIKDSTEPSDKLFRYLSELLSYENQFHEIETGSRKVSLKFLDSEVKTSKRLYSGFLRFSETAVAPDRRLCREIIDLLEARPTIKYFK